MSLIVVATALPFRAGAVPFAARRARIGRSSSICSRAALSVPGSAPPGRPALPSQTLYRVIAVLLMVIALVLLFGHDAAGRRAALLTGAGQFAGVARRFVIGIVAALMGVAGGELLIPTLVLLFGVDIKLAGSLSLAVSLPTMLVGFARYSRDRSFVVLGQNRGFVLTMAAGSIVGTFVGGLLLAWAPSRVLLPLLAMILVASAIKVWRHK